MAESQKIPEFSGNYFEHDDAVSRMSDKLRILVTNMVPAILIKSAGVSLDEVTQDAIVSSGFTIELAKPQQEINVTAWKSLRTFGFSSKHIEDGGYRDLSLRGITVRRHETQSGITKVRMRLARQKEVGSPSHRIRVFKPDKSQPLYTANQRPGDRILFVVYGGYLGQRFVNPAEHQFVRSNPSSKPRQISIRDFTISA